MIRYNTAVLTSTQRRTENQLSLPHAAKNENKTKTKTKKNYKEKRLSREEPVEVESAKAVPASPEDNMEFVEKIGFEMCSRGLSSWSPEASKAKVA